MGARGQEKGVGGPGRQVAARALGDGLGTRARAPPPRLPTRALRPPAPPTLPPFTNTHASLRMYNSLVERCFRECVESFRRKDLDATEEKVREVCVCVRVHVRVRGCLEVWGRACVRVGARSASAAPGCSAHMPPLPPAPPAVRAAVL